MKFLERIPGRVLDDGAWRFELAEELNGGFGGTNGGTLAAVCVCAARSAAPGRIPIGIDARFIRGFRPGVARVVPTVLNEGRTLSTISVDVFTQDGKLSTRSTIAFADPDALAGVDKSGDRRISPELMAYEQGRLWRQPKGPQVIPLIDTFLPRLLGSSEAGIATGTRTIWDEPSATAEAACITADISVGPPVAAALKGLPLAMPNPDITLRFTGARSESDHLVSVCRLEGVHNGLATTSLNVWSGSTLIAVGVSSTTCLKS